MDTDASYDGSYDAFGHMMHICWKLYIDASYVHVWVHAWAHNALSCFGLWTQDTCFDTLS